MSASLVGSEMCIRDSTPSNPPGSSATHRAAMKVALPNAAATAGAAPQHAPQSHDMGRPRTHTGLPRSAPADE
eukprot:10890424-Alexandrium_andersonii.AAC.1